MDILYVVGQFPKLSESFIINEIYELDRRGHDVSVFSLRQSTEDITHTEIQEIDLPIHYADSPSLNSVIDMFDKRLIDRSILQEARYFENPLYHIYWLYIGKQIIEAIDTEGGVDLVHAHFATPNRIAVTYAAAYHNIPCTLTAHANEIFSFTSLRRLRRVCSSFNQVIVPSHYNKRYLATEIGVDADMTVVPATTSTDKFTPSDNHISGRLLTIGRLTEKKGYKYAIEAIANLIDQGYEVEYHIVGTGEREEFLRDRAREYGIEDYVKFLGKVSDEKLQSELHEAEIFVLPCVIASDGDRDVAPVVLKEAMATQTACVSTSISAIPELITDGHDGILVEPNDATALGEALSSLLDDSSRRNEIADNGRKTVENKFDISQTVDELVGIFQSCLRDHDSP
jgi:glycosyltransferase involved in cell wall biosynthesis